MTDRRGFTLLELVLVMVLIGVTMAFAVPRLDLFLPTDSLKRTGRKLTQLILKTSSLAVSTSTPHLLRYESGVRRFTVFSTRKKKEETVLEELQLPEEVSVLDIASPYRELQAGEAMELMFNGQGYMEPCLIHLQTSGGEAMTLKLSPFLSKVSIHEGYLRMDEKTFR